MAASSRQNGETAQFELVRSVQPVGANPRRVAGPGPGRDRPIAPPEATGRRLKDRYILGDVLGHGSLGTTYRAYDQLMQRSVAIKLVAERYADDARFGQRFMAIAAQGGRIIHPHIVTVLDAGFWEGRPFAVMELVEGESLRAVLNRQGALPVHQATTIGIQIADALAAAHRQRIAHGDLRPENVLIDRRGRAKVVDFGFVREAVAADQTLLGGVGQRAAYIPPEQLARDPMDEPADLYALGVLLYELLTGGPPAPARDALRLSARPAQDPISPRQLRPEVPAHVDAAVARALAANPADRFTTAQDLRNALAGQQAGVAPAPAAAPVTWRADRRARSRGSRGVGQQVAMLVPLAASLAILLAGAGLLTFVFPRMFGGFQMVDVPGLVEYDFGEAASIASAHGLEVTVAGTQVTDDRARNTVLGQNPAPNSRLRRGSEVKLTVSAGVRPPNVVGKPLEEARATLVRSGWTVAGVESRTDAPETAGTVVGSRPGPDEAAADKKQGVTLLVSAGNLAHRRPVRLGSGGAGPAELVDGDPNTVGKLPAAAPTWVEIDLARPSTVAAVELIAAQERAGDTIHEVWVWTAGQFRGMHTFVGPTEDNRALTVRFDQPVRDVTAVRIATTQAQGAVGWREIRVFER